MAGPMDYVRREGSQARGTARSADARRGRPAPAKHRGHPAVGDREYTPEEAEFLAAMSRYITTTGRKFPPWSEVLGVLLSLGYAKR